MSVKIPQNNNPRPPVTKCLAAVIMFGLLAGCGINHIHCEIITDEELMRKVLNETPKNGPQKKQTPVLQDSVEN